MDGSSGTSVSAAYLNSKASVYFTSTQKLVVEVYYEAGAEPFAGNTAKGVLYWSILEDNLKAIFKYKSVQPTIIVPKTLSEMHLLPSQNKLES